MNRQASASHSGDKFTPLNLEEDIESQNVEEALHPTKFIPPYDVLRTRLARLQNESLKIRALTRDLGRPDRDSHSLRQKIDFLMGSVGQDIAATSKDLKQLLKKTETRAEKERLRELAVEYQRLLDELEVNERLVIDQCKNFVNNARKIVYNPDLHPVQEADSQPLLSSVHGQSQQQIDIRNLQHEIDYNETIIQERQEEIENISRASELVNELFHNIGVIVSEQQDLVDNIEANAEITANYAKRATRHIAITHYQQKRRTSRLCFTFLLLIIFIIVVLTLINSIL